MQNNTKITKAIAKIVELEGEEIFKNPKKFIALLNDLIPECTNERKVFQRALTEDIFALFLPIYKAPDSGSTNELMRISKRMETELLLSEKHCISVVCCFAVALGWEIPKIEMTSSADDLIMPEENSKEVTTKGRKNANPNIESLLTRAYMFINDEEWLRADHFCEQVLNIEPTNAKAHVGKLLIEYRVKTIEKLANCTVPFSNSKNYKHAFKYSDDSIKKKFLDALNVINERIKMQEQQKKKTQQEQEKINDTKQTYTEPLLSLKTQNLNELKLKTSRKTVIEKSIADNDEKMTIDKEKLNHAKSLCYYIFASSVVIIISTLIFVITETQNALMLIPSIALLVNVMLVIALPLEDKDFSWLAVGICFFTCGLFSMLYSLMVYKEIKNASVKHIQLQSDLPIQLDETKKRIDLLEKQNNEIDYYCQQINAYNTISSIEKAGTYARTVIFVKQTEKSYKTAASTMQSITGYKDADEKAKEYLEKAALLQAQDAPIIEVYNELSIANKKKAELLKRAVTSIFLIKQQIKIISEYSLLKKTIIELKEKAKQFEKTQRGNVIRLSKCNIGENVLFGNYPQNYKSEPIEWRVLDKKNDRLLLVSTKSLFRTDFSTNCTATWAECGLRKKLNGQFYEMAFSEEEKKCILSVKNSTPPTKYYDKIFLGGEDTIDSIFSLSLQEINKYLPSLEDKYAPATPSAKTNGLTALGGDKWWSRSPSYGVDERDGTVVVSCSYTANDDSTNGIQCRDKNDVTVFARPAMWVDIEL